MGIRTSSIAVPFSVSYYVRNAKIDKYLVSTGDFNIDTEEDFDEDEEVSGAPGWCMDDDCFFYRKNYDTIFTISVINKVSKKLVHLVNKDENYDVWRIFSTCKDTLIAFCNDHDLTEYEVLENDVVSQTL